MFIPFESLPISSATRIWIYQSDKKISQVQATFMQEELHTFLSSWTAHQQALQASATIFYHRFVVIGANQQYQEVSGCSIDKQVHFIKDLQKETDMQLLDRSQLAFLQGEEVVLTFPVHQISHAIKSGSVRAESIYFNNAVGNLEQMQTDWKQVASKTWLNRYFEKLSPQM